MERECDAVLNLTVAVRFWKRRWGGRAVVGFIAGKWCRAVLEPVVVMVGGFAEGVVLARDMVMKPSPIGFAWGHISSARAIVGVVGAVWSPCFPAASFDVGYMMWCWCRKNLAEKLGVCRFLPDTSL